MDGIKVEPKLEMTGTKVEPKALRKVFVGGLNLKTTEETFKDHFNQFGELVDCVVMTDPYTKKSRGFGFIEFSTADQVDACQNARPHIIGNCLNYQNSIYYFKKKITEFSIIRYFEHNLDNSLRWKRGRN